MLTANSISNLGATSNFLRAKVGRLAVISLMLAAIGLPSWAQANTWAPVAHIQVEGAAKISLAADLVNISASFSAEDADSQLALQVLEKHFQQLQRSLQRQLPQGASVEAGQVSLYPRRQQQQETWQIVGYTASRDLKLVNLPIATAGQQLEKIIAGKPSQLGPLHYHSSQVSSSRNPALQQALADAHNKAAFMAKSAGQKLGRVLYIEEISSPQVALQRGVMAAEAIMADASTPELNPGQVEATARVRVVFALED